MNLVSLKSQTAIKSKTAIKKKISNCEYIGIVNGINYS